MGQLAFLEEVIADLHKKKVDWSSLTLVFPNKRAGLFFRRYLARHLDTAGLAPRIYSLEEFILGFSDSVLADRLSLVFDLFEVYRKINPHAESFDRFYYWGEMLLHDFEDIDQHLVDPKQIFRGVRDQKELEENFRFLDPEHIKVIQSFWSSFLPTASTQQVNFLRLWEVLNQVYQEFNQQLRKRNEGYRGMLYREVLTFLDMKVKQWEGGSLVFAGFNALTKVEEELIKYFVREVKARVYWDFDSYYMEDQQQEAGVFLRQYEKDQVLGRFFKSSPKNLQKGKKRFHSVGVPLRAGQAKVTGELLAKEEGLNDERTVVVLADEAMLFPVLNSIPENVEDINVTMGFPLKHTPLYSLLQALLELQLNLKPGKGNHRYFYYRHVLSLIRHPYIIELYGEDVRKISDRIEKYNKVYVSSEWLGTFNDLFKELFVQLNEEQLPGYLEAVLLKITEGDPEGLEKEYIHHFLKQLRRLSDLVGERTVKLEMEIFLKLFRQIIQGISIPFSGEPLKGLQVMGILETRNLDFENVIILSMNEGSWPQDNRASSFIPYNIRKAFELPTFDQQESIHAYLFYRLMQRCKRAWFMYNTEEDFNLKGEISRYVRQVELESGYDIEHQLLTIPVNIVTPRPVTIEKNDEVMQRLKTFTTAEDDPKRLTPSALNIYLDCRLKFYFRYITKLYEAEAVQEEIDPGSFGNILHLTMELLYGQFTDERGSSGVTREDVSFLRGRLPEVVEQAFRKHYDLEDEQDFQFEGRNIIARTIILKFANAILDKDELYAPFEVIGLEAGEREGFALELPVGAHKVALKGIIDRIDLKDNVVRVIDYKTGRDEKKMEDLPSLFDRNDKKRNKAGMQVLYYALMFHRSYPEMDYPLVPGIFNSRELFGPEFDVKLRMLNEKGGYSAVQDARPLLDAYEAGLTGLLGEIFDPGVPFDQTEDVKKCRWCPYKGICHRG